MGRENRVALGTAQFGMRYGVANQAGRMPFDEARQIVALARARGLDTLDTAVDYGDSEAVLGRIGVTDMRLVSKLPPVPKDCADIGEWAFAEVRGSLQRLRVGRLHGLLLHKPAELFAPHGTELATALLDIQRAGLAGKIGASIYSPTELEALTRVIPLEIVQAPFSPIDRRLATSGWLARLRASGTEIHVRSVFLQGLLLLPGGERPPYFDRWQPLWARWASWLQESRADAVTACIDFVLSHAAIDRAVVGADSSAHLGQTLDAANSPMSVSLPDALQSTDLDLINPSLWPPR